MQRFICLLFFIIALIWVTPLAPSVCAQTTRAPLPSHNSRPANKPEILTNETIISLVKADFKEKTILTLIRNSVVTFELTATKLIQLKKNGVSESLIQAMIERQTASHGFTALPEDSFFNTDDDFFNAAPQLSLPELSRKNSRPNPDKTESEIFGNRGGSQAQTHNRGGANGSASGASQIQGSATVRIIKPRSETGVEPKLERALKLTNKEIIAMVEAGFSEGTILRKIEITQVDFDISPKALENLRKNRVSDKVLTAMRTAMDETK